MDLEYSNPLSKRKRKKERDKIMEKTITLNETQMKLLKEFQNADAAFFAIQKELSDACLGDASTKGIIDRYMKTCQDRMNKATVFAASVSVEAGSL